MRNYRDSFDIIADILKIVKKNPKKTQIMYQANLSYKVLQKYLNNIINSALINFQEDNRCYTLTAKGQTFLDNYSDYFKSNKSIEKQLNDLLTRKNVLKKLCLPVWLIYFVPSENLDFWFVIWEKKKYLLVYIYWDLFWKQLWITCCLMMNSKQLNFFIILVLIPAKCRKKGYNAVEYQSLWKRIGRKQLKIKHEFEILKRIIFVANYYWFVELNS